MSPESKRERGLFRAGFEAARLRGSQEFLDLPAIQDMAAEIMLLRAAVEALAAASEKRENLLARTEEERQWWRDECLEAWRKL